MRNVLPKLLRKNMADSSIVRTMVNIKTPWCLFCRLLCFLMFSFFTEYQLFKNHISVIIA